MQNSILRQFLTYFLLASSFALGSGAYAERPMTNAAIEFLSALSRDHRSQAMFALDDAERNRWHFIPNEIFERQGVLLKNLDQEQQQLAHALLRAGFSASGYTTVTDIIELEKVLNTLEPNGRFVRDPENYRVSVFGEPTQEGSWAWRFEGHHLSLHFTVANGSVTVSTPTFLGSNPAEVRQGAQTQKQEGQRVLAAREDTARALVIALNDAQRTKAITDVEAPRDIVTGNEFPIDPMALIGISADELDAQQQAMLLQLIRVYTAAMSEDIASARWSKIDSDGISNIHFAWAGSVEIGMPHYYRVQGPSFLIEYDNVQNEANHVHSVWRDFKDDFGRDSLREHYEAVDH